MKKEKGILDKQENERGSFSSSNSGLTNSQPVWTIQRFQKMVQRHPHHTAVIYFGDDLENKEKPLRLTYHEIDQLSNHLAIELASKCHPNDVVAVILAHMHEYLIALLAIWKTGLVFLPLEIVPDKLKNKGECHLDWLTCRIKQAQAKALVIQSDYKSYFSNEILMIEWKAPFIQPDSIISQSFTAIYKNLNDPAYIYCSSGTTQAPKMILNDFSGLPGRVRDVAGLMKLKYNFSIYHPTRDDIRHQPYTIFFYQDLEQWYYSVTDVHRQNILKQLLPEQLKKLISREYKDYNEEEEDEILDILFKEKEFKTLTPPALLGYCGPAFDASLLDFLMIICYGGCLYPVTQQQRRVPGVIPEIFKKANQEKHSISAAVLMPKPLEIICEKEKSLESFQTLTALITMGEKCDPRILSSWFQGIQHLDIYNGYGPTETTIAATVTLINKTRFIKNDPADNLSEELDMHHPLKGVKLFYMEYKTESPRRIFNESEIKALKKDLEVEIIIGGVGIGQYVAPLESKEEAEQVFRNQRDSHFPTYNREGNLHTFKEKDDQIIEIRNLPHSDTQRYYRTGDLAILKTDGKLLFKSRVDNCLKKNGRLILLDPIAEEMQKWPFVNKVILIGVRDHVAAFFIPNGETDEIFFRQQLFTKLKGPLEFERPSFYFLAPKEEKINTLKSMTLKDLCELIPKPKFLIPNDKEVEKLGELHQKIAEIWAEIIFSDVINDEKFSKILTSSALIHFFTPQSNFWCSGGDSLSCSRMLNQILTKLINQDGISSHDFRSDFLENPNIENLTHLVHVCKSITTKSYHDKTSTEPIFLLETIQSEIEDKEFITPIQLKKYDQYSFIKIRINCNKININSVSTRKLLCAILLKKIFWFQNEGLFRLFVPEHFDQKLLEMVKEKFSQLPSKKLKILNDLSNPGETQPDDPGRSIREIKKEFEGHLEVLQEGKGQCCVILCYPLTGDYPDQYSQLMSGGCFYAQDTIIALMMNRRKLEKERELDTIPKKSAYYVKILHSLVPQPEFYIIIGWSFGALVMTQIALDLEKRQKKISLLVNIDCPSPSYIVPIFPLNRAKGLTSALSERPYLTVPLNLIKFEEKEQKSSMNREIFCPQCDIDSFASVYHYYCQINQLTEANFQHSLKALLPSALVKEQTIFEFIFSYLYGKDDLYRLLSIFKCSEINWAAYYQFGHHFPLSAYKKSNIIFKLAIARNKTPNLNEDPNFRHWKNYFEKFSCEEFNSDHFNIFENQDFVQWLKNIINENRMLSKTILRSPVPCNPKEYILDGTLLDEKKIGELKERLEKKTIDSVSLRNHDSLADEKIIGILTQALKGATLTALNLTHIGLGSQGITMLTMDFSTRYLSLINAPIGYLQILNLAGNQLGEKGAKIIADRVFLYFKYLTQLNISNNDFGDEGVKNLIRGLPNSKLRQLELTHNNITQEGTVALAKILAKSSLSLLNLNKNNIRDKGIEALTHYLKHSQVTSIFVTEQKETICHHKMALLNQALEINQQRLSK